jgi:type I restriction enzyme M protein
VSTEEAEDDGEPIEDKMAGLTQQLEEQFVEGMRLEQDIRGNLNALGFLQ